MDNTGMLFLFSFVFLFGHPCLADEYVKGVYKSAVVDLDNETVSSGSMPRSVLDAVVPQVNEKAVYDGIEARVAVACPSIVQCAPGQKCTMHLGFPNCFVPTTACKIIPCSNGGTCVNDLCQCSPGYSGDHCKDIAAVPDFQCTTGSCLNGGVCSYIGGGSKCQCKTGYSGLSCENPLSSCANSFTCLHGGYCSFSPATTSYSCVCVGPWKGVDCSVASVVAQTCNGYRCLNGGYCAHFEGANVVVAYHCVCIDLWQGPDCGIPLFPPSIPVTPRSLPPTAICRPDPCQGDCRCVESCKHENGYVCLTNLGYLGKHCTVPIPVLECNAQDITVDISSAFYNEWDLTQGNSYIYMAPTVDSPASQLQECRARLVGSSYRITIRHPFTQCGTLPTTSGLQLLDVSHAGVVFSNNIWINKNLNNIFDMPFPVVRVQCAYSEEYAVYTSLRPLVQEPVQISDFTSHKVSSTLCKTSTCNAVCPANLVMQPSAIYTVGQILHLGFSIQDIHTQSPPTATAFVHHVRISCNALATTQSFDLYSQGCPTSHGIALQGRMRFNAIGGGNNACLSFRLPRMTTCSEMFIEVRFQICNGNTLSTTCADGSVIQTCPPGRGRRSVNHETSKPLVIGPIYVLQPELGNERVTFLADHSDFAFNSGPSRQNNATKDDFYYQIPAIAQTRATPSNIPGFRLVAFIATLLLLFLGFILTAILLYRRRSATKPDVPGL